MSFECIHPITKKAIILESINPRKWNYDGRIIEVSVSDEQVFMLEDFELCHILLSTIIDTPPAVYKSILDTKLPDDFILAWYDIMNDGYSEEYPKTYGEIFKTLGHHILYNDKLKYRVFENYLMFGRLRLGSAEKDFAEMKSSKDRMKQWYFQKLANQRQSMELPLLPTQSS